MHTGKKYFENWSVALSGSLDGIFTSVTALQHSFPFFTISALRITTWELSTFLYLSASKIKKNPNPTIFSPADEVRPEQLQSLISWLPLLISFLSLRCQTDRTGVVLNTFCLWVKTMHVIENSSNSYLALHMLFTEGFWIFKPRKPFPNSLIKMMGCSREPGV